jgi:sarcosine oxidase
MAQHYDTIVIGLGAMGSAAACHLATRGKRVLGLERWTPAHDRGSSHGQSRIIRQAYFEDPAYVPLLLRAYELWRELEAASGDALLTITGGLMMGQADTPVVSGSLRSAQEHGLPHELLDSADIRRRFPVFNVEPGTVALFEQQAGVLRPEAAIQAHLRQAAEHGAELHFEEPVDQWEATEARVDVRTPRGTYSASTLVITPGAWAPDVLAELDLPIEIERVVQCWFTPRQDEETFSPARFPIYVWDHGDAPAIYGFPLLDRSTGVKVAFHHGGVPCTADTLERAIRPAEIERLRAVLRTRIPALDGELRRAIPCMYSNTPDEDFIIARHPRRPHVAVAAGFSGHGFKFAPVVGEILADLVTLGQSRHEIGLFDPARFTHAT